MCFTAKNGLDEAS